MSILTTVKGIAARGFMIVKDKSPELCFIGGVVAMAAAGYCLWNGKEKVKKALDERTDAMADIKFKEQMVNDGELSPEEYPLKKAKSERFHTNMKTAVAFVKIFAPIVLLSVGSVALFGKSTSIYKGRYLASAAVIAEQNKYIKSLENQVVESTPGGLPEGMTLQEFLATLDLSGPYEFWFDERSREFIDGNYDANRKTLLRMYRILNDKKRAEWALYLNQVIKYMDIHTGNEHSCMGTDLGQIMGFSMSKNPEDGAEETIEFGIDWDNTDFSKPVLLRFNCDKKPLIGRVGMAKK